MHDPNLNYLRANEAHANDRHHELLREAEAHRLANLAVGPREALRRRLPVQLLLALLAPLRGALRLLSVRRRDSVA
ncbi:MAG: hypothetical protein ACOC9Z_04305 [Chloroflexota bacterium]